MLFNSFQYFVFFVAVLVVANLLLGRFSGVRTVFILLASFYFYYSNNHWQILLLLFTTTIDYLICRRMENTRNLAGRKFLLAASLVSNLGLLFYFKYINFFGESLQTFADAIGYKLDWVDYNVLLPVGISFYTFEALSYTIDVYRGEIRVERNWVRLAFLVSFFPHLIAGPIVRARDFFPQIGPRFHLSSGDFEKALVLIAVGLFKKMILADTLAIYADRAFSHPGGLGAFEAWLGVYAFSFQIYFDFSGYTDIALGSALLLGYRLPDNFNRPYVAASITEFWRRWHITLSNWLRDYLYISLGGSRTRTRFGTYRNLILTMFLGGLWHGAAWHFAIWGVLHGVLLAAERALGIRAGADRRKPGVMERLVRGMLIFQIATALWIPFRAESLQDAARLFATMFSVRGTMLTDGMMLAAAIIVLAWLWQAVLEVAPKVGRWDGAVLWPVRAVAFSGVIVMVLIASSSEPRPFIYFQF